MFYGQVWLIVGSEAYTINKIYFMLLCVLYMLYVAVMFGQCLEYVALVKLLGKLHVAVGQ